MGNILVFLEKKVNIDNLTDNSLTALLAANKLSSILKSNIFCVLHNGTEQTFNEISKFVDATIINVKNDIQISQKEINTILYIAKEKDCSNIVFPSSIFCNDLAPALSVKLEASFISETNNFNLKNNDNTNELIVRRYLYAGKLIEDFNLSNLKNNMFVIAPNSFELPQNINSNTNTVNNYSVEDFNLNTNTNTNYSILENIQERNTKSIDDAKIIVSCGRGIGSIDNFSIIDEFANKLGASIAASRAVVDNGWQPHSIQVGQTGKTVTPDLYIACGISGAVQHIVGMNKSKFIIAINTDVNAPIFEIADVAVNADLFNIIKKLISLF